MNYNLDTGMFPTPNQNVEYSGMFRETSCGAHLSRPYEQQTASNRTCETSHSRHYSGDTDEID